MGFIALNRCRLFYPIYQRAVFLVETKSSDVIITITFFSFDTVTTTRWIMTISQAFRAENKFRRDIWNVNRLPYGLASGMDCVGAIGLHSWVTRAQVNAAI